MNSQVIDHPIVLLTRELSNINFSTFSQLKIHYSSIKNKFGTKIEGLPKLRFNIVPQKSFPPFQLGNYLNVRKDVKSNALISALTAAYATNHIFYRQLQGLLDAEWIAHELSLCVTIISLRSDLRKELRRHWTEVRRWLELSENAKKLRSFLLPLVRSRPNILTHILDHIMGGKITPNFPYDITPFPKLTYRHSMVLHALVNSGGELERKLAEKIGITPPVFSNYSRFLKNNSIVVNAPVITPENIGFNKLLLILTGPSDEENTILNSLSYVCELITVTLIHNSIYVISFLKPPRSAISSIGGKLKQASENWNVLFFGKIDPQYSFRYDAHGVTKGDKDPVLQHIPTVNQFRYTGKPITLSETQKKILREILRSRNLELASLQKKLKVRRKTLIDALSTLQNSGVAYWQYRSISFPNFIYCIAMCSANSEKFLQFQKWSKSNLPFVEGHLAMGRENTALFKIGGRATDIRDATEKLSALLGANITFHTYKNTIPTASKIEYRGNTWLFRDSFAFLTS